MNLGCHGDGTTYLKSSNDNPLVCHYCLPPSAQQQISPLHLTISAFSTDEANESVYNKQATKPYLTGPTVLATREAGKMTLLRCRVMSSGNAISALGESETDTLTSLQHKPLPANCGTHNYQCDNFTQSTSLIFSISLPSNPNNPSPPTREHPRQPQTTPLPSPVLQNSVPYGTRRDTIHAEPEMIPRGSRPLPNQSEFQLGATDRLLGIPNAVMRSGTPFLGECHATWRRHASGRRRLRTRTRSGLVEFGAVPGGQSPRWLLVMPDNATVSCCQWCRCAAPKTPRLQH